MSKIIPIIYFFRSFINTDTTAIISNSYYTFSFFPLIGRFLFVIFKKYPFFNIYITSCCTYHYTKIILFFFGFRITKLYITIGNKYRKKAKKRTMSAIDIVFLELCLNIYTNKRIFALLWR